MKALKNVAAATLLTVCYLYAPAQVSNPPINEPDHNKPRLFADLPLKTDLLVSNLEGLLNFQKGAEININIATGLRLSGTIISKSNPKDQAVKSIVIKTSNRQGAIFIFSRLQKPDGTFSYTGRMVSRSAGDALEIVLENNRYVLLKKDYHELVNE